MSPPSRPVRFGPYLLLERVATGGMAEVFKAKKAGAGARDFVAIKRIHPTIAQDPAFVEMFLDEARIAKELHHPNIARILDMGQVGRSPYLVMEYVHGRDLRAVLQRVRERGERVPAPMACHVISKVCEGLHHAHDKRDAQGEPLELVHRDVSPQNILVSTAGHVKLIDFGVAKAATTASKTHSGMLKGKLGYMSPEQVRGLPLDRRSDIFAAGIVLYELLTGERLFVGSTDFSTLERIRNVDIQPPSEVAAEVPPELERIVLRALARDPEDRPPTAMDFHDALQAHLYSSGSIFGSGDLSRWLHGVFSREIEAEGIREEQYRLLEEEMADDRDKLGGPDTERHPKVPERGAGGARKGAPARSRTMVGMGAPQAPAPAPAPAGGADLGEWDDDDMATQVYDKAEHGSLTPSTPPPAPAQVRTSTPPPMPPRGRTSTPPPPPPGRGRTSAPPTPPPGGGRSSTPQARPGRASTPSAVSGTPLRTSVPPPRPRRAGPGPATQPDNLAPTVEVRDEPPLRGDPTIQDRPGTGAAALAAQDASRPPRRRRPRERTELIERPQASNRGTLIALGVMGLLMLLGLGLGAYAVMGPKSPGTIQLVTEPPDATVLLDEEPVAATSSPFIIRRVEPNTVHLLEVRKEGFRPWSMQVDLQPGEVLDLPPVTLRPAQEPPATAAAPDEAPSEEAAEADELGEKGPAPSEAGTGLQIVHFHSRPEGARVEIERGDERRVVGFTPTWARMAIEGGPWTVRISNMGYETWEKDIALPGGADDHRVRATLTRKESTARAAPAPRRAPRARPKPKQEAPVAEAKPKQETQATSSAPEPKAASATGDGTLRISTRPWTNVSVGGRNIGSTPQMNISLPPGSHRVRLTNPEFGIDETLTVKIEPGQTVTKILNLTTPE
jgi:eukaryotic-like serine/threonine-protein kinase